MGALAGKQPEKVFQYFEEICGIPHGSSNLQMISDYLVSFATEKNLRFRRDEKLNVIIWKEASAGYEESDPVILQGHMDMVAVRDDDVSKNMETDGLDLAVDGDMLYAKGTSLGGDDGVALAYALAVLADDTLAHPPIEAVFTADEEIGMLGADYIDVADLKGRLLMNIDSEDEGIFTVSCAGGACASCILPYSREKVHSGQMEIRIDGLTGGHSGVQIQNGSLNANIAMGRILYSLSKNVDIRVISIRGGEKDNAIPIYCEAALALLDESGKPASACVNEVFDTIKREYEAVDKHMQLSVEVTAPKTSAAFTKESTEKLIAALMNLPNGIQRMNPEMKDMVQTSLNLGILSTEDSVVKMLFAVRSSSETQKRYLLDRLNSLMAVLGGYVTISGVYPGWEYRPDSRLRDTMVEAYRFLYGEAPVVQGIHAGLECGLFAAKLPGLDAISFGPQIYGIHTTSERLSIKSTERTWRLILKTLEMLK